MIHAVIMAGGTGTRFWPASRQSFPKQLLKLAGERSMIQATVSRLGDLVPEDRVLVVTNSKLVRNIQDQLPNVPGSSIIGEPCKRDTAPCVGLAAMWVLRNDPDASMVVMPSDHVIATDEQFQSSIRHAVELVRANSARLVTFGIRPTYPAESFGYIERGAPLANEAGGSGAPATFAVTRFHEKPKQAVAQQYLEAGHFLWNSGIFVWQAATIVELLKQFEPDMTEHLEEIIRTVDTPEFPKAFDQHFHAIQGRSIDYAVMERATEVAVIEAPFSWDDVGSWQAISRLHAPDTNGNTVDGKFLGLDTKGSIIRGSEDHLIVTLGIEDCIVVHTPDATLVARKDQEESIRKVVQQLGDQGWDNFL